MKAMRKLAAAAVAAGLVAASAPASAVLTLQFFDRADLFLGSLDQNSFFGDTTNPNKAEINLSGVKFVNGWSLNVTAGYSQLNPLELFMAGNIKHERAFNAVGTNATNANTVAGGAGFIGLQNNAFAALGFVGSANAVNAATLKVRLVETNFPGVTAGQQSQLNDNLAMSSNPLQGGGNPQTIQVQIQSGTTADGLGAGGTGSNGFSAPTAPSGVSSGVTTLCGTGPVTSLAACGVAGLQQGFNQTYSFTPTANPLQFAPFFTTPPMLAYTGASRIFGQVNDLNSGFILIAGFDITTNSLVASNAAGLGFTNTVTVNFIPEPGTLALLGVSLLGLAAIRRKRVA